MAGKREEGGCCGGGATDAAGASGNLLAQFRDFMKATGTPGLVDQKTKKLTAIALSISHRCRPCFEIHVRSALKMGITKAEIDEIAGLATGFGGCSSLMFYQEGCKDLKV